MSKLEWSEANLPTLKKLFLMKMRGNMRAGGVVRLGRTGNGSNPNYQVEYPGVGKKFTYNGLSHKQDSSADIFDESNISQPFTIAHIEEAIAKAPSAAGR